MVRDNVDDAQVRPRRWRGRGGRRESEDSGARVRRHNDPGAGAPGDEEMRRHCAPWAERLAELDVEDAEVLRVGVEEPDGGGIPVVGVQDRAKVNVPGEDVRSRELQRQGVNVRRGKGGREARGSGNWASM